MMLILLKYHTWVKTLDVLVPQHRSHNVYYISLSIEMITLLCLLSHVLFNCTSKAGVLFNQSFFKDTHGTTLYLSVISCWSHVKFDQNAYSFLTDIFTINEDKDTIIITNINITQDTDLLILKILLKKCFRTWDMNMMKLTINKWVESILTTSWN